MPVMKSQQLRFLEGFVANYTKIFKSSVSIYRNTGRSCKNTSCRLMFPKPFSSYLKLLEVCLSHDGTTKNIPTREEEKRKALK